jgi:Alpha-kinase family
MSPTGNHKKGGFKMAYFGKSSRPLFSDDRNICAKQSFYTKTKTVTRRDGRSVKIQQDIPYYDSIKQAQDLIMEVTCLNWAHALLEMVYIFIGDWKDKQSGKSKEIEVPELRFVKAGLAIEQVNEGERHCFLLEEVIPEREGFRKYLNNTSAVPRRFVGEDDNNRAEFLAFAQHVQYLKTKKGAYVADFQG